jgi:ParB family transcriptional regulator, chromosome partitioning protein
MAESADVIYEKGKLYHLAIADLQHDPDQPRKYFDEQALNELKASIDKHGVLEPVLIRKGTNGGAMLISGERRCQAAKLAGWRDIPAVFTDGDPREISIVENLLRENLTAIEEAEAIEQLRTQHNYELSDLSITLGKSVPMLSEILSLNKLPDEVKDDCRNDPKTARSILVEIAKKKSPATMISLYTRYKESGLTRGEIRKKSRAAKLIGAPAALTYISLCAEKIDTLDFAALDQMQKDSLLQDLTKLRSSISKIFKLLKT